MVPTACPEERFTPKENDAVFPAVIVIFVDESGVMATGRIVALSLAVSLAVSNSPPPVTLTVLVTADPPPDTFRFKTIGG
jgi:hypothetical protein